LFHKIQSTSFKVFFQGVLHKMLFKKNVLSNSVAIALVGFTMPSLSQAEELEIEEVIVEGGIRASLKKSMDIKRDTAGVADAISAEDMGKFPDTNLAEALQRITGVSIDRSRGEGNKVTVRGFGPEYNLVTLNGRQMPTYEGRSFSFGDLASEGVAAVVVNKTGDASVPSGGIGALINIISTKPLEAGYVRSFGSKAMFDTSVMKTDDIFPVTQNENITPEISGLISDTFFDDMLGVSLSLSYQKRKNEDRRAVVGGWKTFVAEADGPKYSAPSDAATGHSAGGIHQNRPSTAEWAQWFEDNGMPTGLATTSIPQNLVYERDTYEAERKNGQLTLQFRPIESLTVTLDETRSGLEFESNYNGLSAWFSGRDASRQDIIWDTSSPNATPLLYREELLNKPNPDYPVAQGSRRQKTENASTGLNLEWFANDRFELEIDYHYSTAKSGPKDDINGTGSNITISSFNRCVSKAYFTEDFPLLVIGMDAQNCVAPDETSGQDTEPDHDIHINDMIIAGSVISNGKGHMDIEQGKILGSYDLSDFASIDFGLELTEVTSNTRSAVVQRNSWGGISDPGDLNHELNNALDEGVITRDSMSGFFDAISGGEYEHIQTTFFDMDIEALSALAATYPVIELESVRGGSCVEGWQDEPATRNFYCAPTDYTNIRETTEKTKAAFFQVSGDLDLSLPTNLRLGMRYEDTKVKSTALISTPIMTSWTGGDEFLITQKYEVYKRDENGELIRDENGDLVEFAPDPTVGRGGYGVFLPNFDLNVEISEDVVGRFSYSHTITRPPYSTLEAGTAVGGEIYRYGNVSASSGNPDLKPIEARNLDLSLEWYYGDTDYFSLGYFKKKVYNFIGSDKITINSEDVYSWLDENNNEVFGLPDVADGGEYEAVLLDNPDIQPYETGKVSANLPDYGPGNPLISDPEVHGRHDFVIARPVNNKEAAVYGWELNLQHNFGESGYGVIANYTMPWADVAYNNYLVQIDCPEDDEAVGKRCVEPQFALSGLSESANLIAFYDKDGFSVRIAYNWRDDFYVGNGHNEGAAYDENENRIAENPQYTQAYAQVDISATYEVNDNLTIMLDGLNVTDETTRRYAREKIQVMEVSQNGPRYNLGFRYTF
jgi:TonB-dependent receptor